MEHLQKTALAHYEGLSDSDKDKAEELFKSWDTDGDGKIDIKEFYRKLNQRGINYKDGEDLFTKLDTNGDDKLNFAEFVTLYYILTNGLLLFCDECRVFLEGGYFTCGECYDNSIVDSFDICSSCHKSNAFTHHNGAAFVYKCFMPRRIKKLQPASLPQPRVSKRSRMKKWAKSCVETMIEVAAVAPGVVAIFQSCFESQ